MARVSKTSASTSGNYAKPGRVRRSPEVARESILTAAEALLLDKGPQALKLIDIAQQVNVSHGTVLHHFGSIDEVQAALADRMIRQLGARISERRGAEKDDQREAASALFDAFGSPAATRLAAWLELTGEIRRLTIVQDVVRDAVEAESKRSSRALAELEDRVLLSIVVALGCGLFGRSVAELLGRPPETARRLVLKLLKG